jgi:hypothetical protein
VIDRARASLQARIGRTRARIDGTRAPEPDGLTDRELRRDLNAAENAELALYWSKSRPLALNWAFMLPASIR